MSEITMVISEGCGSVSVLSVIFLQKTFARWLYTAVVLLRAK